MSWIGRLASAAKSLLGIGERNDEAASAVNSPSMGGITPPPPLSDFDFNRIIPDIGSLPLPPVAAKPEIEDVADFIDLLDLRDEYAQNLLEKGWFDSDISPDMRHDAREAFFEYTGWEEDEFPWDDWREWYDAA